VAILGIGAYRLGFGRLDAVVGRQDARTAQSLTWVLPNPSGLNAHYGLEALTREFRLLRAAVEEESARRRR
jgi:TDG/mug DNA glycosylase family protein